MRIPFWVKLAALFSGVILLGTFIAAIVEFRRQSESIRTGYQSQAELLAATLTPVFLEPLVRGYIPSQDHYRNVLTRIVAANPELRLVRVLDEDGRPIGIDPGRGESIDPEHHLQLLQPIELRPEGGRSRAIGWLELHFHTGQLDELLTAQVRRSAESAAAFVALSLIAALLISRLVTVPLRGLAAAMGRLREGDLEIHVPSTSRDEVGDLAMAFNEMVEGLRAKQELLRYVSTTAWDAAHKRATGDRAEGKLKTLTLLFADISGFTSFSETSPPGEVVSSLNSYFDAMVRIVVRHDGIVDKFIGDALMAVFEGDDQGAGAALAAARDMQVELESMRRREKTTFHAKIGINTGDVIQGDIGSIEFRRDHTCIGDPVNVASRLCFACPVDRIHIGYTTWQRLRPPPAAERRVGLKVKGKERGLETYVVSALECQ